MKKLLIFLAVAALLLTSVAVFYKIGWRYTGFRLVAHPNVISVTRVTSDDEKIVLEGTTDLKIGSYEGFITEENNGVLYLGIRYSIFGDKHDFRIEIPDPDKSIKRIALKNRDKVRTVWMRPWERN